MIRSEQSGEREGQRCTELMHIQTQSEISTGKSHFKEAIFSTRTGGLNRDTNEILLC